MINLPIDFNQLDPRWKDILLGNNTDPKFSIGNDGCLLDDLCAICKYFGIDTDPIRLNELLKNLQPSGFTSGGGDYIWGSLIKLFPQLTEKLTNTPDVLTDAQIGEIKSAIDAKFPVMIQIEASGTDPNSGTHYVTIVDYNNADENDFTIYDPYGGKVHSLKDYLGWFRPSARKDINQYVIYSGPLQSATTDNCLLPNTPENQQTFKDLVHGSTQWDATVSKYLPGKDPKATDFSSLQDTVAGIQSSATAAGNARDKALSDLAVANQTITNDGEKLAEEEKQRQDDATNYEAQIAALNAGSPATTKLIDTLRGQIGALQGQVKQLNEDKHGLTIEVAKLQQEQNPTTGLAGFLFSLAIWAKNHTK